jgi:ADP-heptose:LPS heptosyltransferase
MVDRILIVRLSALGDVALTLPLLSALRDSLPSAHLGWVVDEPFLPLLKDLSQLNRIHVWTKNDRGPSAFWRLIREIQAEDYQVSLDPQGLTRSALIPFLCRIPMRVGFRHGPMEGRELAPLFTNCKVAVPDDRRHVSSRNLYLGSALGLDMPEQISVELPEDPAAEVKIRQWWKRKKLSPQTLVFGIGAGWPTKMWPAEAMATLIDEALDRGYGCVMLWGPQERDRLSVWQSQLGEKVVWAPETDIREMIAILRLCERYAGPDSAALHLAWLLGKPTFSWFGASDPARCAPRGKAHAFVAKGPHTWHRKGDALQGLQTLSEKEVFPAFRNWLTNEHE